jgi:hypothetical protein
MSGQGSSGLSSEVNERILDRIAGLEKIIAPELVKQALATTGKQLTRECKLNSGVMTWVVLSMGLLTELPIRQVFEACRRLRHGERTPARSSLCMARQRLGSEPLATLYQLVVRPLATPHTLGAVYRGMRKVGIDGTVLNVPDCDGHQHRGRSSGSRGQGAFPQIRKVSLVELGTHIELAFVSRWRNDYPQNGFNSTSTRSVWATRSNGTAPWGRFTFHERSFPTTISSICPEHSGND